MSRFVTMSTAVALGVTALVAQPAAAEQYKDYTPQKGAWNVQAMEVDPNHVDEYLVGIRKTLVVGFEILKKRGLIDDYWIMSRMNYTKDSPNVLIGVHYPSLAALEPDKARDEAIDKEVYAAFSKEATDKTVKAYETYRKIVDIAFYNAIDYPK